MSSFDTFINDLSQIQYVSQNLRYEKSTGEKVAQAVGSVVWNGTFGGLWTWGAVACVTAGGWWWILAVICILGAVGSAMQLIGGVVNAFGGR